MVKHFTFLGTTSLYKMEASYRNISERNLKFKNF
jgi:hypothetical protein